MPIESRIFPEENDSGAKRHILNLDITPIGQSQVLGNFIGKGVEILLIKCRNDDLGGEVYAINVDDISVIKEMPQEKIINKTFVANIEPGKPYEQDIYTKDGAKGKLVLRHIGFTLN